MSLFIPLLLPEQHSGRHFAFHSATKQNQINFFARTKYQFLSKYNSCSYQSHLFRDTDWISLIRKGWTFLVRTWKLLANLLIKWSLPNQSSYLRFFTSCAMHCCKIQNFKEKKRQSRLLKQCLEIQALWLIAPLLYKQLEEEYLLSYLVNHGWIITDYQIFYL